MKARSRQPAAPPRAAELATALARRLVPQRAAALARVFAQFEAAIDQIDDVQDGARPISALLPAHQKLLQSLLHAAPELRTLLLEAGLELLRGQREDLAGLRLQRRSSASLSRVQSRKTGTLFALFFEAVAREAKRPPQPFVRWARSYGTLLQHLSDAASLFAEDAPEDWLLLRPTRALSLPLRHPKTSANMVRLIAGDRRLPGRLAAVRYLARRAGVIEALEQDLSALNQLTSRKTPGDKASEQIMGAAQRKLATSLTALATTVREALPERLAEAALKDRAAQAVEQAVRFLRAPHSQDLTEIQRWGLFGKKQVVADVFGPLVVIEALAPTACAAKLPLERWFQQVLARAEPDGLRYYPGHPEIPPDTDDAGLLLQVARALGVQAHPALRKARAQIRGNIRKDGLVDTWVGTRSLPSREIAARWVSEPCPAVSANAWLGLGERPQGRVGWAFAPSTFYSSITSLALIARWARFCGDQPLAARALTRLRAQQAVDGSFGLTLETALAVRALAAAPKPFALEAAVVCLLDAQAIDGGFAADPYFKTVGRSGTGWYASRVLTTALVLRALSDVLPSLGQEASWGLPRSGAAVQGG